MSTPKGTYEVFHPPIGPAPEHVCSLPPVGDCAAGSIWQCGTCKIRWVRTESVSPGQDIHRKWERLQ
jgi:hypothetical protein